MPGQHSEQRGSDSAHGESVSRRKSIEGASHTVPGLEPLEPRLLLSGTAPSQGLVEPVSASAAEVNAAAVGNEVVFQEQTQYDNFFKPNVIAFDYPVDTDAINGMIEIAALSDLDYFSESVAYDIEGIVTGDLFTGDDDGLRPFTAIINLTDQDLSELAADGNLHIEFTPSNDVNDFANVQEYVTVGLTYEVPLFSSITGRVWADINADGIRDLDEPGTPGVRVFLDDDDNGQLDWTDTDADGVWTEGEGERWTFTSQDLPATATQDEAGEYRFDLLPGGDYRIVVESQPWLSMTSSANPRWSGPTIDHTSVSAPDNYPGLGFGTGVAESGNRLLATAYLPPTEGYLGGAYIYHKTTDGYHLEATLRVSEHTGVDWLSPKEAAMNNNWAALSGWSSTPDYEGPAVTMFHRTGSTWSQHSVIHPSGIDLSESWALKNATVAMSDDTLVIASSMTQQAWAFELVNGVWTQVADLTPDDLGQVTFLNRGDEFGDDIAIEGDTIIIGAPGQIDEFGNTGTVYVYERSQGVWAQATKLDHNDPFTVKMGGSVDIKGDLIVVGGPNRTGTIYRSYTYVFRKTPDHGWQFEQKLEGNDLASRDRMGDSVAIVGDTIVAFAPDRDEHGVYVGAAYLFEYVGNAWVQTRKIVESEFGSGDGWSARMLGVGDTFLLASPGYDGDIFVEGRLFFYLPANGNFTSSFTIDSGQDHVVQDIAAQMLPPAISLLPSYDTGHSQTDRITSHNNSDTASRLGFKVDGVLPGSLVTLYRDDGVVIGSGISSGYTVDVTTDGVAPLPDGLQFIEARVTLPGGHMQPGAWINVSIDTVSPLVEFQTQSSVAQAPRLHGTIDSPTTEVSVTISGHNLPADIDKNGRWSIAPGIIPPLTIGLHDVLVHAVDSASNTTDTLFENGLVATHGAQIDGVVWQDENSDGVRDPEDTGIPGVAVYLDLDIDGEWDPDEPRQLTASDQGDTATNEAGRYSFTGLPEGDYYVRVDTSGTDYYVTSPGSLESQWSSLVLEDTLISPFSRESDGFGNHFALSEHILVVGAYNYHPQAYLRHEGAVIYTRDGYGSPWELATYIDPRILDGDSLGAIGYRVATNDTFVFVSAPSSQRINPSSSFDALGAVYVLEKDSESGVWLPRGVLTGTQGELYRLGGSLAAEGNTLVAGGVDSSSQIGGVYVYEQDLDAPTGWSRTAHLAASPDAGTESYYGETVALSGDLLAVGATADPGAGGYAGAVYLYKRNESEPQGWGLIQKIASPNAPEGGNFGSQISFADDLIVIGDRDTVYLYEPDPQIADTWVHVPESQFHADQSFNGDQLLSLMLTREVSHDGKWPVAQAVPEFYQTFIDGEFLVDGVRRLENDYRGALEFYRFAGDNPWHHLQLQPAQTFAAGDFGIANPLAATPAKPILTAGTDTGFSNSDRVTRYNNASPQTTLSFEVLGVEPDATARLYADGVLIGEAVATNEPTTVITTDGSTTLADGTHSITVVQHIIGKRDSLPSEPLFITIDTTGPRVVGSSLQQGDVLDPGHWSVTLTVDESLDEAVLQAAMAELSTGVPGTSSSTVVVKPLTYDSHAKTLSAEFDLAENVDYRFSLNPYLIEQSVLQDLAGNLLDGEIPDGPIPPNISGNGVPGGAFVIQFSTGDAPQLSGDLNGDGFVGIDDLGFVIVNWNDTVPAGSKTQGDATGDGYVGIDDLTLVLSNWNTGSPPSSGDLSLMMQQAAMRDPVTAEVKENVLLEKQSEIDPIFTAADAVFEPMQPGLVRRYALPQTPTPVAADNTPHLNQSTGTSTKSALAALAWRRAPSNQPMLSQGYTPWSLRSESSESTLGLWDDADYL